VRPWPYPFWIAHRGAGELAPENTLAAFRQGASYGYRMFECDAKLSADGVVFLLHDATLERTTDGQGAAGLRPWAALAQLDAGRWHSAEYAGEPLPTLAAVVRYCLANDFQLNIEIKPSPGAERETGRAVARELRGLWRQERSWPLLSSFYPEALEAARVEHPECPLGLLLHTLPPNWLAAAQQLGCQAVVCLHTLWNADTVAAVHQAGLRALSYTVNDPGEAQRLIALGTDGIVTDRVDVFRPEGPNEWINPRL